MNLFHEAKKVLDKDGKVNPLGPYGKSKLSGREVSTYFRRNPVKDPKVKRAVEVALDLSGADSIARKEIAKFYGSKILKSKEVQSALQYANESVQEENLVENYRKLAQYGMGTETSRSARVGLEMDFYDEKGNKQFGKILQKTNTGYLVKDDKGKKHVFKYHDRKKAKEMLKPNYIHVEDAEAKAKLNLKHVQDMEKLKDQQKREKENMSEHKNILDAYKEMWENGVKYAPSIKEDIDFEKDLELLESLLINEVTDKEIMAMRKVSKDMQKVLKDYQKIATMGDKELKDTKHNAAYKKVLDARDTVLTMIGTLQTKKLMTKESLMDTYKKMHEESLMEAEIVYRVRDMQRPEETKFKQAQRMGVAVSMKKQGKDTIVTVKGTKKNLRDFDSIARGKSSYGDPSTIKHFDEK